MTAHRDLKIIIRARMAKTGESYTTARAHVLRERERNGTSAEDGVKTLAPIEQTVIEAAVLKVNQQSARIRSIGRTEQVTLRSSDAYRLAPGQIATVRIERSWSHRGYLYATGAVEATRVDIPGLGLDPLPLEDQGLFDARDGFEPYRRPDPYAPLWRRITAKPKPAVEMDAIAWDAIAARTKDFDSSPVCDAAELREAGDDAAARELLMDVLCEDLRCIDAHAHLGNLVFDRRPDDAMVHYLVGIGIGDLSLGASFDGFLPWGFLYNRPYLRCLHGYALCLWRAGHKAKAEETFERILALNPNDNQGARFCRYGARQGESWEEFCDENSDSSASELSM